jgi:hypothetical protein
MIIKMMTPMPIPLPFFFPLEYLYSPSNSPFEAENKSVVAASNPS